MRHFTSTLRFVSSEERFSIYTDTAGEEVYLAHGTAIVLRDMADLDLTVMWARHSSVRWEFLDLLRGLLIDDDEADQVVFCDHCGYPSEDDTDHRSTSDGSVCKDCFDDYYYWCDDCEEAKTSSNYLGAGLDRSVCDRCHTRNYSWCGDCEEYYLDEDVHEHQHDGCDCESPARHFEVRNVSESSDTTLWNDTETTVTLPAGIIADEGIGAVARYLRSVAFDHDDAMRSGLNDLSYNLAELGNRWQAKEGNFTKRLSRFAYKRFGIKLAPEVVSHVGNLASSHATAVDFKIEVTRDLNMPADAFGHGESCYWQSYFASRCTLKSAGAFGLRTFTTNQWGNTVAGRAWVMPVRRDGDTFRHTFDAVNPDAYIVFNGYGDLEGYAPARLMAHMTGMTYRKIKFSCGEMYINSDAGYLVAPEDLADLYTDGAVHLHTDPHAGIFDAENRSMTNA